MNFLFLKDADLNFKYSQSLRNRDFQYRDQKGLLIFLMPVKAPKIIRIGHRTPKN